MRARLLLSSRLPATLLLALALSACSSKNKLTEAREQAEAAFNAGNYEKAKISYISLARLETTNAASLAKLGKIWMLQGVPLRALTFLQEALKKAPGDVESRVLLATAYLSAGGAKEAHREALTVLDTAPDNQEALMLVVDTARTPEELNTARLRAEKFPVRDCVAVHVANTVFAMRSGDLAGARQEIARAFAADPKSAVARIAAGKMHMAKREFPAAESEFRTAAGLAPLRSIPRLTLAEFKLNSGGYAEAVKLAEEVISQAPDYVPALVLSAQASVGLKDSTGAKATLEKVFKVDRDHLAARILQAEILITDGDLKTAQDVLKRLITVYPNQPLVDFHLALAYARGGDMEGALPLLEQAVSVAPGYVEPVVLLAELNLLRGQAGEADGPLREVLGKRPNLVQAASLLATAYDMLGRTDAAITVMKKLVEDAPGNPAYQVQYGKILSKAGRFDEARAAMEQALALRPDELSIVRELVDLDVARKDYTSALARAESIMAKRPDSPEGLYLQGRIHAGAKEWDKAKPLLLKAVEIDPTHFAAYQLLIDCYLLTGEMPNALKRLEELLKQKPDNKQAWMISALIYDRQQQYAQARDAYEKLLALKKDIPMALNNVASIYSQRLPDAAKAFDYASRARALRPGGDITASPTIRRETGFIADTLAWIHFQRGEYSRALNLIEESIAVVGDKPEIQYHRGMIAYQLGKTDLARTSLQLAAAGPAGEDFPGKSEIPAKLALLGTSTGGTPAMASAELEALATKSPSDVVLQTRLAEAFENEKNFPKAVEVYERVLKVNPKLTDQALRLARLYSGPLKDGKKALEVAGKARDAAPDDPRVAVDAGAIALECGDYPLAYRLMQEGARVIKNDPVVSSNLATATYTQGYVQEARRIMEPLRNAALEPARLEEVTAFLDFTALTPGNAALTAAEARIKEWTARKPDFLPALMASASLSAAKGNVAAAAEAGENILRRFPAFDPAKKLLVSLYVDDPTRQDRAYDLAGQAIARTMADDGELVGMLASLSFQRKEFNRVVQLLERNGSKRPLNAGELYVLSMSLVKVAPADRARKALNQALQAGLTGEKAETVRKALDSLPK